MDSQFQIENIGEGTKFNQVIIKNTETKEFISILPELGARLNAAHLIASEKLIPVLKELDNAEFKTNDELFNNAKLFPFAGRIRKGVYSFQNQTHQLPQNYSEEENACHGFLYQEKFDVLSKNIFQNFAEIELCYCSKDGFDGYPFSFNITVTHRLSGTGQVTTSTTVENLSNSQILFSDGWHLYYRLGDSVDDLVIGFSGKEKIELNPYKVPSGNRTKLKGYKPITLGIKNNELDDVYKLQSQNNKHEINLISKASGIILNLWQESGINKYNYLVLYTPPDRKSIAIEPITSNIDSFNSKEDIIILNPGTKWSASYGFELNKINN